MAGAWHLAREERAENKRKAKKTCPSENVISMEKWFVGSCGF